VSTVNFFKKQGESLLLYMQRPDYPGGYKITKVPLSAKIEIVEQNRIVAPTLRFRFEEDDGTIPD